ncbi:MAG: polysaccharide biosynthesis/export family protein [Vicingus serpentipes]|nr:polysaccharide biosynthesis/export family protein [Vicingus serpentipes]
MMKTKKGYQFDAAPSDSLSEYVISTSDILRFRLYTNDGTSLVDLTAISENQAQRVTDNNITYLVEHDGFVRLPIVGRIELRGKTIREAEHYLEEQYVKYYIKPFVKLNVINRRITVFPGGGSKGKVIELNNENTTMLEALGQVGGLTEDGKAYRIKLVRGNLKNPQVYLFDFSTLEGIKEAGFVLQANDIIYVENRGNILRQSIRDIAPIVSLITSTLTLIIVINNLK